MKFAILHLRQKGGLRHLIIPADDVTIEKRVILRNCGREVFDMTGSIEAWSEYEDSHEAYKTLATLEAAHEVFKEVADLKVQAELTEKELNTLIKERLKWAARGGAKPNIHEILKQTIHS